MRRSGKHRSRVRIDAIFVWVTVAALVTVFFLGVAWRAVRPQVVPGAFTTSWGESGILSQSFEFLGAPSGTIRGTFTLVIPHIYPMVFRVLPDDCLEEFSVNDMAVTAPLVPFCDYAAGRALDLRGKLHGGRNTITFVVRNNGGMAGFSLRPAASDPLVRVLKMLFLLILAAYSTFVLFRFRKRNVWVPLAVIGAWGALLRVLYVLVTPYTLRAHDAGGHLEYVRYVAERWAIPPAHLGFEMYQPPLYYFLSALLWRLGQALGFSHVQNMFLLQVFSLVLSIGMFLVGVWVGSMVWPMLKKASRMGFLLFAALLATLPGLVFLSSRINNDTLSQFSFFLFALILFRYWQSPSRMGWLALVFIIAASMLTKSHGVLLLPIAVAVIFCHRRVSWRARLASSVIMVALVAMFTGWFFVPRFLSERADLRAGFIGNVATLTNTVAITPRTLLLFNPLGVLAHPFNDPFNDVARKNYLWEYFFRSAFFGEFSFGPSYIFLARAILLLAMILLPVALCGAIRDFFSFGRSKTFPLSLCLFIFFPVLLFHRIVFPFSSSQDFRYAAIIALPVCLYLLVTHARLHRLHIVVFSATSVLVFFFGLFLVTLALS